MLKTQFQPQREREREREDSVSNMATNGLIFRKTVIINRKNHTKHINTLYEQNKDCFLFLKQMLHIFSTALQQQQQQQQQHILAERVRNTTVIMVQTVTHENGIFLI